MKTNQRGQILLIIILLSTVLVTVALSVSQVTTQETKIAKLEEDSKRAFAAAEAGIEAQLKNTTGNTDIKNILPSSLGDYINSSSQATTTTNTAIQFDKDIRRDDQYTFYLSNYDPITKQFSNAFPLPNPSPGYLTFYFLTCSSSDSSSCPAVQPAIELTFIGTNNTNIARKLIDPVPVMNGTTNGTDIIPMDAVGPYQLTINGSPAYLKYKTQPNSLVISANVKLMLIRVLIPATTTANTLKVVVVGSVTLPPQGQTITSTATTQTGVAKKITLFQSYPQIPADLFVTSF